MPMTPDTLADFVIPTPTPAPAVLLIEALYDGHLPATFGPGAWHVISDPSALPRALTEVYGRLTS